LPILNPKKFKIPSKFLSNKYLFHNKIRKKLASYKIGKK